MKKIEYEKRKQLKIEADKITEIRKKYAKMIENEIVNELNYMGMENIILRLILKR